MNVKKGMICLVVAAMILNLFSGCATLQVSAEGNVPSQETSVSCSVTENPLKELSGGENAGAEKPYTLLVYMVGSNLESLGGYASSDLKEMQESGLLGEHANLLVYTGGAASWDLDIPSDVNTVYRLSDDGSAFQAVAATSRNRNMGDGDTLLDFLEFACATYPAEKYGLIFWDHGNGPLYGFGSDELYDNDTLTLPELQSALEASPFQTKKLEFVGFDACLMASAEVAATVKDYARYLVASEEVESGSGWVYGFLETLNTTTDTETLLARILETYEEAMQKNMWKPEYTLSLVDLQAIPQLVTALDAVWATLSDELTNNGYTKLARNRNETKRFGVSAVSDRSSSFDLVDLNDFLEKLNTPEADAAQTALKKAVTAQVSNVENTCGLSLYYPYDNADLYRTGGSTALPALSEQHRSYIASFAQHWLSGDTGVRQSEDQKIQTLENELTLELEEAQLEVLGSATYAVLEYDPETDSYAPRLSGMTVTPDENGVLHIPRDPDIFLMETDLSDECGWLWHAALVENGKNRDQYITVGTNFFASMDLIVGDVEPIQIAFSCDRDSGNVEIQSVLSQNWADTEFYGSQDVDASNWSIIGLMWDPLYVTWDSDGNLLPWSEWESDGSFTVRTVAYEDTFRLITQPLHEREGQFYCQLTVKDTSGNVIGTWMEELYRNTPYEDRTAITSSGTITYRVYEDYTEVIGFKAAEGGDQTVTVPTRFGGVPVTVIGADAFRGATDITCVVLPQTIEKIDYRAFYGCRNLTQINFPEGLRTIGAWAFYNAALTELHLPDSLETLGYESFAFNDMTHVTIPSGVRQVLAGCFIYCQNLKSISVAEENTAYKSVDGVLFSADGKRLVAFPAAYGESYTIPDGVEILEEEAMRGNAMLTRLNFSEGLRIIEPLALCDVNTLLYLKLPESLEVIGTAAFGDSTFQTPGQISAVKIGQNVRYIGSEAFAAYAIGAYEVAAGNEVYSSANGCLLNASGTRLLEAPSGRKGTLEIPDGVSYLTWYSLYYCDEVTELILPDSLVGINHAAGVPKLLQRIHVGKNLQDWQNVSAFFSVSEIEIHPDNPWYTLAEDGSIYSGDGTKLLLCRSEEETVVIPEGVTTIGTGAFQSLYGDAATMKHLSLPSTLESIPYRAFYRLTALESFSVSDRNPNFVVWDDLLYTRDGKTLIACPAAKTGTVTVRTGTEELAAYAMYTYYMKADTVVIPEGVTAIRAGNFTSLPYSAMMTLHLPESLQYIHTDMFYGVYPETIVLYCPAGSEAERFAKEAGLNPIQSR